METPQIKMINIEDVKPYWRNARKNDNAVAPVAQSIKLYGFNQPIVVDGKHTIIVGHTRYRAAKSLGLTEVPCIVSTLNKEKARQYRIIDNKSHELATWDTEALYLELRDIDFGESFEGMESIIDFGVDFSSDFHKDITPQDISSAKNAMDTQFDNNEANREGRKVNMDCPKCYHRFSVQL